MPWEKVLAAVFVLCVLASTSEKAGWIQRYFSAISAGRLQSGVTVVLHGEVVVLVGVWMAAAAAVAAAFAAAVVVVVVVVVVAEEAAVAVVVEVVEVGWAALDAPQGS